MINPFSFSFLTFNIFLLRTLKKINKHISFLFSSSFYGEKKGKILEIKKHLKMKMKNNIPFPKIMNFYELLGRVFGKTKQKMVQSLIKSNLFYIPENKCKD